MTSQLCHITRHKILLHSYFFKLTMLSSGNKILIKTSGNVKDFLPKN